MGCKIIQDKEIREMTRAQIVNEHVQAMIRKDGGPLCQVEIWHKNGRHGFETYDPRTAEQIKRDVEFNGGKAEITRIR
jgi:hypothetical protein